MMMDRFRVVLRRINPRLEYFKDKKIVCSYETRIADLALEIGKTLGDERWRHALGWHSGQVERCKLVISRPEELPTFTTADANLSAGKAITHSPVACNAANV